MRDADVVEPAKVDDVKIAIMTFNEWYELGEKLARQIL